MHLPKLIAAVVVFLLICGCTTTARGGDSSPVITPETAAIADIITTDIALQQGARETNPLGVGGALVAKGVYLFVLRPTLTESQRKDSDQLASSVWIGAAANNLVVILLPGIPFLALAVGLSTGWTIYHNY